MWGDVMAFGPVVKGLLSMQDELALNLEVLQRGFATAVTKWQTVVPVLSLLCSGGNAWTARGRTFWSEQNIEISSARVVLEHFS